jgi:putative inorganic carbon (HCO3(-)) transporter
MHRTIKYLDLLIYWLIVLIPFSIAIAPAAAHTFIGFLTFFFLLKKILKRERLFIQTPVNLPFMFLILAALLSFKNSVSYPDSIRGIFKMIQNAFTLLICAEEIKDRKHILRIFLSIVCGALLVSVDALWQIASGRDFIRGNELKLAIGLIRPTASFPNPNILGIYLTAITPLILGLTLFYYKGKRKIALLFVSALACSGVFLTLSRGAGLGLFLGTLFLSLTRKNRLITLVLIGILLIYPFIMPRNIKDWARKVNYNPAVFMLNPDRISIYRNALNMIRYHPLFGVGVNTFCRNYLTYKLPEPSGAETADHMYAHNNFLHMAADIGLLGLAAFIWFLFNLFQQAIRVYRGAKDEYYRIVSLSLVACLIAFLINGLTETSLYYSRVAMIFWYLVGFSLSLNKFIQRDE